MLEANASPRTASTGGALRERWRPQLMLLLPALAAVMAVASLSIALRSQERMIGKPLTDDSYYSLSVAENVADGHNVTIDGTHLTNGFQPLFTFATVPAFMVTDSKAAAIRIVTVMEWLLFVATAALLGLIAVSAWGGEEREERRWIFWTLASLYLAATYALLNHFNGLETGCVLFFYALTWWLYQRGIARTLPGCVALGAVLGLTVLTRIDAAFLVAAVVAVQLLAPGKGALAQRAARAVAIGASAVVVSLPWWIYNVAEFGSLMPSSGTAEQDISIAPTRFPQLIFGAFKVAAPWLSLGARDHNRPAELVRILIVVGIIALLCLQRGALREAIRRAGEDTPLRRHLEFGAALAVTKAALSVWYLQTSGATGF
jgi:4-amino-4-deoxy-L-arabinose transferase-like glycosyltransferase